MNEHSDPVFTLPRALLRSVTEIDASCGWRSLPVLREPRVLDIGSGEGAFAVVASQVWPGARIRCHEPRPEALAVLVQNTRGLAVECTNILDPAAWAPCDVLRIDTQSTELALLDRYPHLRSVSVLLATTRGDEEKARAEAIASRVGLKSAGRHAGSNGASTGRFVRVEMLTRAAVEELPPSGGGVPLGVERTDLQPIALGSRPLHLYVSMIAGPGKAWSAVEHSLHALGLLCMKQGIGLTLVRESMAGVDRARNVQTERCLDLVRSSTAADRPTHMLQLDSDIVFNAEDILRLMRSDLDVTAIVYPRKEIDWVRVARAVKAGVPARALPEYAASFVVNYTSGQGLRHPELGTFLEVEEVGTGCLMVKVEALAKYVDAYREELEYVTDYEPLYAVHHQVFHCERDPSCAREVTLRTLKGAATNLLRAAEAGRPIDEERGALCDAALAWGRTVGDPTTIGRYLTEDYSFCRRWRMLGGKVYALMEAELGHIGKHVYRGTLQWAVPVRDRPSEGG